MMIAVAVAASLVTYAWVMGYLGFTTAKVGKAIQIQSIALNPSNSSELYVYVQNVGQGQVNLIEVYVNGIKMTTGTSLPKSLVEGATQEIIIKKTPPDVFSGLIKVRAVTEDGTFTESTVTLP
jgi:FlaG/FlaF family flagellin (archaellin)